MKKDANRRGKGETFAARVFSNISSDRAAQRTQLLKPHKTNQLRGSWDAALRGTNDFSLSGNSAEDTFDLRGVIASATRIPYSLRDVKRERK